MSEQVDFSELAAQAQQGDKQAMDRLAEKAFERLRIYVYRLTLQEDLTQEIVQETLLEMVKVIGKLQDTNRFLPWLYGIATNKLRHYYRSEQAMKRAASRSTGDQALMDRQEGLENLLSQELRDIITGAIESLKTNHRAVLIMRCYDGMSYAEIADSMGCTEFGSRMLFLRAKRALQKQLAKSGLGKGSLLAALTLFGKITSPSEAAAAQLTVTAAATQAGLAASTVAAATSKSGLVTLAAAGALAVGTTVGPWSPFDRSADSVETAVVGHLTEPTFARGFEKRWYFSPDIASDAVCRRFNLDPVGGGAQWAVLEDTHACYLYQDGRLTIRNARHWQPTVARSPWDSPELRAFLTRIDGADVPLGQLPSRRENAFYGYVRNVETGEIEDSYRKDLNVLYKDVFQVDWGSEVGQVDLRDPMHRRGWTYFKVDGQLDGQVLTGRGCIPFVLDAYRSHRPWLNLRYGSSQLVDTVAGAWVRSGPGRISRLKAGSFFSGLSRPWVGFHSVDVVRRDAAERQYPFSTEFDPDGRTAVVTVDCGAGAGLVYEIDLESDLVRRIDIQVDGQRRGQVTLHYYQDVGPVASDFRAARPSERVPTGNRVAGSGPAWLVDLLLGRL